MIKEDIVKTHIQTTGFKETQEGILQTQRQIQEYKKELEDLKYQRTMLVAAGKKESNEYKNIDKRIKELNGSLTQQKAKYETLMGTLNMSAMSFNQLKKRAGELKKELDSVSKTVEPERWNRLNNQLKNVQQQMDKVRSGMRNASAEFGKGQSIFARAFGSVKKFGPLAILTSAVASAAQKVKQFVAESIPAFREYDDKLADVMKTTGLTKNETELLSKSLKRIDTRTSQNELLDLARVAGKLGLSDKVDVEGFVRAADKINVALSEDLGGNAEEALNQVGKLVDIFNIKQQFGIENSMIRVGSTINELGAASTANEGYIVEFTKRLAGVAPSANISIQNVMGYGATLDQFGQQCETAGTAMSQAITGMFKRTEVYARIANMSLKDFIELLNQDANAAFIAFLKGLKNNNAGMVDLVKNLNDLKMDGTRSVQIIGALAENVDALEQQQKLANKAFSDGTSIIDEFNTKNNTAQARYEKFQKTLQNIKVQIGSALVPTLDALHSLISAISSDSVELLQGEFEMYKKTSSEIANKKQRVEELTATYEQLRGKSNLNAEQQNILNDTVKQLGEICPEAITKYNQYGEAIEINIEKLDRAIERQRQLNLLMAKRVASKSAKGIKDEWETLQTNIAARATNIEYAGKLQDRIAKGDITERNDALRELPFIEQRINRNNENIQESTMNLLQYINTLRELGVSYEAISKDSGVSVENLVTLNKSNVGADISKQRSEGKGYADIAKGMGVPVKLIIDIASTNDSNFNRPVNNKQEVDQGSSPVNIPESSDKSTNKWSLNQDQQFLQAKAELRNKLRSGEISSEQEYNEQLLQLEIDTLQKRIALQKENGSDLAKLQSDLADRQYTQKKNEQTRLSKLIEASLEGGKNPDLQQEIDQENYNYERRLKDLGLFNKDRSAMTKEELDALENLERIHNENLRYLYIEDLQRKFDLKKQAVDNEINELKAAHNAQLAEATTFEQKKALVAQLYGEDRAKAVRTEQQALKLIRQKFTSEEEAQMRENVERLIEIYTQMMAELERTLASADVTGMTDADKAEVQATLNKLRAILANLNAGNTSGDDNEKDGNDVVLGVREDEWEKFFDNIKYGMDGFEDWIQAINTIGKSMLYAFSSVSQLMTAIENRQFKTYEKTAEKKKKLLEQQKKAGIITEETYNDKVQAIDEETEAKREEMERKQAIRDKAIAVFQSLIATAVGISKALPNIPLSIAVGALGAIQTAAILATPLPGAELGGLINVEREQDGKRFYAEFSPNRRGFVNKPTVIVGENGPEYVIPNKMLQNPEVAGFVQAIEAARLKGEFRNPFSITASGRESGGPTVSFPAPVGVSSSMDPKLLSALLVAVEKLNGKLDKPVQAYLKKYGSGGLYDEMAKDSRIRKTL
nr:MAG TPA: tail tape measure protein [Caudoviricetes sp.]